MEYGDVVVVQPRFSYFLFAFVWAMLLTFWVGLHGFDLPPNPVPAWVLVPVTVIGAWIWFFGVTLYKSVIWFLKKDEIVTIERGTAIVTHVTELESVTLRGLLSSSHLILRFSSGKKIIINSQMEGYARFVAELRISHPELFERRMRG